MKTGLIVNFHLPSHLSKPETDVAVSKYYSPIFKTLKNLRGSFSISMSLSFLEVLHKHGYLNLINDIKALIVLKKAELVDTTAYNPIMHYINDYSIEKQIVFNEFGLGYYFGKNRDFDGDKCIMVEDLNGFYPADNCVDARVIGMLVDFGYKWSVIDSSLLNKSGGLYRVSGSDFYLVAAAERGSSDRDGFVAINLDHSSLLKNNTMDMFDTLSLEIATNKTSIVTVSELMDELDGQEISISDIKECHELHGIKISEYKAAISTAETDLKAISHANIVEPDETFVETPFWVDTVQKPAFEEVCRELMCLKAMDFHNFHE